VDAINVSKPSPPSAVYDPRPPINTSSPLEPWSPCNVSIPSGFDAVSDSLKNVLTCVTTSSPVICV
jgi:hypothetical protein